MFASSGWVGYALVQCSRAKLVLAKRTRIRSWIFRTPDRDDMPIEMISGVCTGNSSSQYRGNIAYKAFELLYYIAFFFSVMNLRYK